MCQGLEALARKVVPMVWKGSAQFRLTTCHGWGGWEVAGRQSPSAAMVDEELSVWGKKERRI
jgi:hypothetical protein